MILMTGGDPHDGVIDVCDACGGDGDVNMAGSPCDWCGGTGFVLYEDDDFDDDDYEDAT